jgi:hypothetical protein
LRQRDAKNEIRTKVTDTSSSRETASSHARGAPETLIAASIVPLGENSFKLGLAAEPDADPDVAADDTLDGWAARSDTSVPVFVPASDELSDSRSLPALRDRPGRKGGGWSEVLMFHEPVMSALSRLMVKKFEAGAEKGEGGDRMPGERNGRGGEFRLALWGDRGAYGGGASAWGA